VNVDVRGMRVLCKGRNYRSVSGSLQQCSAFVDFHEHALLEQAADMVRAALKASRDVKQAWRSSPLLTADASFIYVLPDSAAGSFAFQQYTGPAFPKTGAKGPVPLYTLVPHSKPPAPQSAAASDNDSAAAALERLSLSEHGFLACTKADTEAILERICDAATKVRGWARGWEHREKVLLACICLHGMRAGA
jgi:hypothetical protein